jgi:hypothetical protein
MTARHLGRSPVRARPACPRGAGDDGVPLRLCSRTNRTKRRSSASSPRCGLGALHLGVSISPDELAIGFTLGLLRLPAGLVIAQIALQALIVSNLTTLGQRQDALLLLAEASGSIVNAQTPALADFRNSGRPNSRTVARVSPLRARRRSASVPSGLSLGGGLR